MNSENNKNIITGQINAGNSAIVGDNNTIVNNYFVEASIIEHLETDLKKIEVQIIETKNRILDNPETKEFKIDLVRFQQEQNEKINRLENAKKALFDSLLKFAKTFNNTEKIKVLEELFTKNELREVLEYLHEKADLPESEIELDDFKRIRRENKNKINQLKSQFDKDANTLLNICENLSREQLSIYQLEIVEDLLFFSEFYFSSIQNKELSVTLSNTALKIASPFKNKYEAAKEAIRISKKILIKWEKAKFQ